MLRITCADSTTSVSLTLRALSSCAHRTLSSFWCHHQHVSVSPRSFTSSRYSRLPGSSVLQYFFGLTFGSLWEYAFIRWFTRAFPRMLTCSVFRTLLPMGDRSIAAAASPHPLLSQLPPRQVMGTWNLDGQLLHFTHHLVMQQLEHWFDSKAMFFPLSHTGYCISSLLIT